MLRAFQDHPASVGESYLEHMGQAFSFGSAMVVSGIACLMISVPVVKMAGKSLDELEGFWLAVAMGWPIVVPATPSSMRSVSCAANSRSGISCRLRK